jgi:hypothetical protein
MSDSEMHNGSSSEENNTSERKRERKNVFTKALVCLEYPDFLQEEDEAVEVSFNRNGVIYELQLVHREAILRKTKRERAEAQRKYRQEYSQRPDVREKIKARLSDPVNIEKRNQYANDEKVKLRKKQLAMQSRLLKKRLREEEPKIYNRLLNEVQTDINQVINEISK